jgi:asparagine synthase (glutamine-hydrolysing)
MCGIVGLLTFASPSPLIEGDPLLIERLRDTMAHRGPDGAGVYRAPHIALGQRRLSIIDLAGGAQPMASADESLWVLNNGEIYNYRELRATLSQNGAQFRTQSDTEAILHAYRAYGDETPVHLRGMFALAVWDAERGRLLLARDRAGQKPLYYAHTPHGLFFASELKALLKIPPAFLPRSLDLQAVADYFTYQSIPDPLTIFAGICKLPPAHLLTCNLDGQLDLRPYWRWDKAEASPALPYAEAVFSLRDTLEDAVRSHLVADVPLGALLSGGVDSSAVVAMMARAGGRVRTFTIGFGAADYDERAHARRIADHYGTTHQDLVLEPRHARDVLPHLAWGYDEPFADMSALPTYYVCQMARTQVTVALGGDGGDEAFAGYERYAKLENLQKWGGLRSIAQFFDPLAPFGLIGTRTLRLLAEPPPARYQRMNTLIEGRVLPRLWMGDLPAPRYLIKGEGLSAWQRADFAVYLPSTVLTKVDRASMLNSLEVRAPLLDHLLLETVASYPAAWLRGKRILKDALRGLVPDENLDRPKQGFGLPLPAWFAGDFAGYAREVLLDKQTQERGLLNLAYVERLLKRQARPYMEVTGALWALLMFELWCRAHF